MPPPTFDPLSNQRTSQVLFQIMRGVDTPTGIARKMQVGPTAVMDQLHKLQKARVVRPGEKTGKQQHYAVSWEALAIEAYYSTVIRSFGHPSARERVRSRGEAFVKDFPGFVEFLRTYFVVLVSSATSRDHRSVTCSDWLNALYGDVESMVDPDNPWELVLDDPFLTRFSEPLREWADATRALMNPVSSPILMETMDRLGFKSSREKR